VPGVARGSPIEPETLFAAVTQTMRRCRGGFAVVMLVHNVGVLAFRDPWGIRPLVLGRKPSKTVAGGVDYAISSESVALDTLGYELCRDVSPGEAILALPDRSAFREAPREGLVSLMCHENPRLYPCIFEYVYFARPDSTMNGVSVYSAQLKMGEKLAAKIKRTIGGRPPVDVVIAVPDTSRPIALQCAYSLGVVYREGFIKNRYIGRTFIMPGQAERRKGVRMKLNTIKSEFKGRSVLLIDDSIVRGTTSMELVAMAREAGATNVYFVSASPEVRYPNVYGINISKHKELIAHERTPDEIAAILRADWVLFQDLGDLEDCVRELNPQLAEFENSVFSGDYVTDADEPPDSRPESPSKKKTPSPVITPEDVKLAALRI
jgi:amidophosphoribosyltransferase